MPKHSNQQRSSSSTLSESRRRYPRTRSTNSEPRRTRIMLNAPTPPLTPVHRYRTRQNSRRTSTPLIPSKHLEKASYKASPDFFVGKAEATLSSTDGSTSQVHTAPASEDIGHQFVDKLIGLCEDLKYQSGGCDSKPGNVASTRKTRSDTWKQTLERLVTTCVGVKARSEPLVMLEEKLVLKQEELDQKEKLLVEIDQARDDAMTCGITRDFDDKIYIVIPCGHTFSEEALHGYFRNAVKDELIRLKDFYKEIPIHSLTADMFHKDFFFELSAGSAIFKPNYACGTCRKRMTGPPVQCSTFLDLGARLHQILEDVGEKRASSPEPPAGPFPCNLVDYFLFHSRTRPST